MDCPHSGKMPAWIWFDGGSYEEYDNGRKDCGENLTKRLELGRVLEL